MPLSPAEVRAVLAEDLSLNATLERLGIQRADAKFGLYDHVDASGVVLFTGNAGRCWDWLRSVADGNVVLG